MTGVMSWTRSRYLTLAEWQVQPGKEDAFIAAWEGLGRTFQSLPDPPEGDGTLIRSVEDPSRFYSFGPWASLQDIGRMRASPEAQSALGKVRALCVSASPGAYEVVRDGTAD